MGSSVNGHSLQEKPRTRAIDEATLFTIGNKREPDFSITGPRKGKIQWQRPEPPTMGIEFESEAHIERQDYSRPDQDCECT